MLDGVSRRPGLCGGRRGRRRFAWAFGLVAAALSWPAVGAGGQEGPYFVTYGRGMEEPGNLEVSLAPVLGGQRWSSSTASGPGGRRSSISTARRRPATARS
jgi:hypothetical protein